MEEGEPADAQGGDGPPGLEVLKVTEEAIIEVLEKEPKWKLPKNAKARSSRHRTR